MPPDEGNPQGDSPAAPQSIPEVIPPTLSHRSPAISISVLPFLTEDPSVEVTAVVDTGFEGFILIPMSVGIMCNMNLWGVSGSTLADGRQVTNITAFGNVKFAGKVNPGIFVLSVADAAPLVGMEFIRAFGMDLVVSPGEAKSYFKDTASGTTIEAPPRV